MLASPTARRVLGALAVSVLLAAMARPAAGEAVAGSAGTDTSLPATDSQVTVHGRGTFADLEITVNQTRELVNQAISITWTGGAPTLQAPTSGGRFFANFLQVMQCWGDDDGTVPDNPGPPTGQCVFGAASGAVVGGGAVHGLFGAGSSADERWISEKGWENFDPSEGFLDKKNGDRLVKPFVAVDGTVINAHNDPAFDPTTGGDYWLNTYFNQVTTNEIVAARTGPNGKGSGLFEATTGVESSGLGCGQEVEPVDGGSPRVPKCWLVIVPRGEAADENVGTSSFSTVEYVVTSPLSHQAWQNRIAIPLEFNPVDSPCSLADDLRRVAGTELALPAVVSWQPALCTKPGLPPYSYGLLSDAGARQQLLRAGAGAPGMIVVSRPFDPTTLDPDNPVTYAPISLSALVIGFNVERLPRANPAPPPEEAALSGVRVADINLTPRLVAKLLTQSYGSQLAIAGPPPADIGWVKENPPYLGRDPDFLQFNPEFELMANNGKNFGGLVLSGLNSDAAGQVWEWIFSDPEARAWLDGAADPWGMQVNPAYATTAAANSTGAAFGDPLPSSFPKGDSYCHVEMPFHSINASEDVVPAPLCGADWMPYAQGMREAARATRAADDGSRAIKNDSARGTSDAWSRAGPQTPGSRTILSLTDSASAIQYGIQMARLSRAGDNGPGRGFIAPDAAGLDAGVAAMAPKDEPAVLEPVPLASAPSAYPLTALTYAATTPLSLDAQARKEYAAFVDYAAGPGQVPGLELGQLPRGFAPLPESLRAQATAAATTIRELQPAASTTTTTGAATATAPAGSTSQGPGAASNTPSASSSGSTSAASGQAPASTPPASPATVTVTDATPTPAPLTRALTPVLALARSRFVLPALVVVLLFSALGALEITKRRRRVRESGQPTDYRMTTKAVGGLARKKS